MQLALFPGMAPSDGPAAPAAPETHDERPREVEPPMLSGQMGLFDEQVRRLRAAGEAVAAGDLPVALALLGEVPAELDATIPVMHERVLTLVGTLDRVRTLGVPGQMQAYLQYGRSLAADAEPWASLGRALIERAAALLGPAEGVRAARLLLEAGKPARARDVALAQPGPPDAATLFVLGDIEVALSDARAARRHYRDALLIDPFDPGFEQVADEQVAGLAYLAEYEVEVGANPRAWAAPVGIVAGILPRPSELTSRLPVPARVSDDAVALLDRVRQFVDALVLAAAPEVQRDREVLLDLRRRMKQASVPLFAWYMARQA